MMKVNFLLAFALLWSASAFAQDSLKVAADTPRKNVVDDSLNKSLISDSTAKGVGTVIADTAVKSLSITDTTQQSTVAGGDDLMNILGEDAVPEPQKVFATFKSTYLISAQTNETVKRGTLDFRITHRFGDVAGSGGGIHNFYGFDQASNIRFSFEYGVTDRLQLGFARSKVNEHLDASVKYKFVEQMEGGFPLSIVGYSSIALTPKRDLNNEFGTFTNRISYAWQLVATTKVNRELSLGFMPTLVHRNMIHASVNDNNGAEETNDIFSMGVMGRMKLTPSFAIIAEYFYTFSDYRKNNTANPYYMPLGLGVEIETGGHVFQINLTNTSGIIYQDFIPNSSDSWMKGQYKLGFTISRVFGVVR
ncbi:MAG: DUF5777 family beta-barrel protein [Flavobacteriales bacterium]